MSIQFGILLHGINKSNTFTNLCSFVLGALRPLDNLTGKGVLMLWETESNVYPLGPVRRKRKIVGMTSSAVQVILMLSFIVGKYEHCVKRNLLQRHTHTLFPRFQSEKEELEK